MSGAIVSLNGNAFAFETVTVADSAIGFTAATFQTGSHPHVKALVTVFGGVMRFRYDGTNPTAAVGHIISHGESMAIEGTANIAKFRAIRAGAVSGYLTVTYEAVYG